MLSRFADQDPLFVFLAVSVDAGLIAFAAWAAAQRLWTWAGDTRALAALRPTPAVAALRPTRAVAALRLTRG